MDFCIQDLPPLRLRGKRCGQRVFRQWLNLELPTPLRKLYGTRTSDVPPRKAKQRTCEPASPAVSATRWLRERIAGGAQYGNENLGMANHACVPVDDRYGLAGVVDEQLFASAVLLALDHVDHGSPESVVLAEPAVVKPWG